MAAASFAAENEVLKEAQGELNRLARLAELQAAEEEQARLDAEEEARRQAAERARIAAEEAEEVSLCTCAFVPRSIACTCAVSAMSAHTL